MRRLILKLLERILRWGRARLTTEHQIEGFSVLYENLRPDIDESIVLERFVEALKLIQATQPWRFAHMRRDVTQFWIVRYPVRGMFSPASRTVMTELTFLARRDIGPATVASSILHEAVHARIHAMNLRPESRHRDREERICRRAELAFGLALPPEVGAPVVARAQESLDAPAGELDFPIDWQAAQKGMLAADRTERRRRRGAA
jgi:hypothetical protein